MFYAIPKKRLLTVSVKSDILGNVRRRRTRTREAKMIDGLAYLRVSGMGQVKGDGFPRQRDAVQRRAKAERIRLVGEYRDEGVKGASELENRPGLAALLDHIESNGVRIVLIERSDRLARDLMVGEVILDQFRKLGVRVVCGDGTDLTADDDPTRVLIRQVLGAVAQFDKSVVVAKLRAARDRLRRRNGRCEGRKPFGYYEGESEIVDRIYRLRRKPRGSSKPRMSYAKIAAQLTADNVPSRTGKPWHFQTVRDILQRPKPKATA